MKLPRLYLFTAIIFGLLCAAAAPAQTGTVSIVSGNGQIACPSCNGGAYGVGISFEPMIVKVADASGNPIAGATVQWNVIAGSIVLVGPTSVTDANGLAQNIVYPYMPIPGANYYPARITATYGTSSVWFYETQSLNDAYSFIRTTLLDESLLGTTFSGPAGSQSATKIRVQVFDNYGDRIPNVSARLVSYETSTPPATCVTGAGADPGSALSDSDGVVTCTVQFGSKVVTNQVVYLMIGGVNSSSRPLTPTPGQPTGWVQYQFAITVTPSTPGMISKVAGDSQSANPGQTLPTVLQARVTDVAGQALISGASVAWTVTPAGAATFGNGATTTSDANGLVSNTVQLSSAAAGPIQIKAALVSNSSISTTFSETANIIVTVGTLNKASGDQQTAVVGTAFAQPIVVQATGSNGQALVNFPLQFSVSGPATLSNGSAVTDSSGRAQVSVTAGATAGSVAVTVTAGARTATFNLTVVPVGPQITSFVNGAQFFTSYDGNHSALSPCSLGTLYGKGIAPTLQGAAYGSMFGPAPYTVAGVSISFNNAAAPIFAVINSNGVEQVNFQVPCDVTPASNVPVTVTANGGTANVTTIVRAASPGIFEWVQSDQTRRGIVLRATGEWVSKETPARKGDVVRLYVTGLGATLPAVAGTNSLPPFGDNAMALGQIIVGVNNAGVRVVQSRLSPDLIGVYEIDFQIPNDAPSGDNVVLSVAVNATDGSATQFSAGSRIPIQ